MKLQHAIYMACRRTTRIRYVFEVFNEKKINCRTHGYDVLFQIMDTIQFRKFQKFLLKKKALLKFFQNL